MSSQSTVSSVVSEEDVSLEESGTFDLKNGFLRSEPNPLNPHQPILNVAPLNCVPYIGQTNPDDIFSSSSQENVEAAETVSPAMIFLPSQSTREELNDIMNATRNGVLLTGAAPTGTMGPRTGKVDIGESADSYYFRVILAGVSSDERDFSCDIEPNGTVLIKGMLKTGEKIVCRNYEMFHTLTENVGPPGPFTISFRLPGPVDPQQVISNLADGILEVTVKKRVKAYVISGGGKEYQDEDNAFVVMPAFSKDQISDLPETFPPNSNTQFRGNRRERGSDEEDNDKEKRNSIGNQLHTASPFSSSFSQKRVMPCKKLTFELCPARVLQGRFIMQLGNIRFGWFGSGVGAGAGAPLPRGFEPLNFFHPFLSSAEEDEC